MIDMRDHLKQPRYLNSSSKKLTGAGRVREFTERRPHDKREK